MYLPQDDGERREEETDRGFRKGEVFVEVLVKKFATTLLGKFQRCPKFICLIKKVKIRILFFLFLILEFKICQLFR